jgi:hypothetical protein
MKDTVITALTGFSGAVTGAASVLLSGVLSNRAQAQRLEKENVRLASLKLADLKRGFLEELYVESDRFNKAMGAVFVWSAIFMNDKMDAKEFGEKSQQEFKTFPARLDRVEFLIAAYFPDLAPQWKTVKTTQNHANAIRPLTGGGRRPEHITRENQAAFGKLIDEFDRNIESFKVGITLAVRQLDT